MAGRISFPMAELEKVVAQISTRGCQAYSNYGLFV